MSENEFHSQVSQEERDKLYALPTDKLVEMYNGIARKKGLPEVNKFENKSIAVKRVWDHMEHEEPEQAPATEAYEEAVEKFNEEETMSPPHPDEYAGTSALAKDEKAEEPKARRKRQMYFNFPVKDEIKPARVGSLRERVVKRLLAGGLTFEQVVEEVKAFDADRKREGKDLRGSDEFPERRAYEIIRICHYYLGYGLRQSDSGVITAFEKK